MDLGDVTRRVQLYLEQVVEAIESWICRDDVSVSNCVNSANDYIPLVQAAALVAKHGNADVAAAIAAVKREHLTLGKGSHRRL